MTKLETLKKIKLIKKFFKDKKTVEEILKKSETKDVFEIIGMILTNKKNCDFESDCFKKYKKEEEEYLNFLECPNIEEGMFECFKCKSKKIFTISKQTRRGDESTTVFARCSNCKNGWIVN